MEGGCALSGGEGKKAAAMTKVIRPKPNFADRVFKFCLGLALLTGWEKMRASSWPVVVGRGGEAGTIINRSEIPALLLVSSLFSSKSAIALGSCYFVLLSYIAISYIAISNPHLEKLRLLPFFGVAVAVPLYAAALMKECGH